MSGRRGSAAKDRGERTEWDEGEEVEFTVSKDVEVKATFEAMGLKEELLRGIYDYGEPTGVNYVSGNRVAWAHSRRMWGYQGLRSLRQSSSVPSCPLFRARM